MHKYQRFSVESAAAVGSLMVRALDHRGFESAWKLFPSCPSQACFRRSGKKILSQGGIAALCNNCKELSGFDIRSCESDKGSFQTSINMYRKEENIHILIQAPYVFGKNSLPVANIFSFSCQTSEKEVCTILQ